ncbi:MAG: NAD(P)-dependent oxidoreductase [Ardenticatenales bacterium]|nr:NAD(P)-dependent oxidoreductase [Ardenticatenales bacterium]
MEQVGFIGLGIMGMGMARRLIDAGYPVTLWNRTASRAETLIEQGAIWAESPRAVAARSDIIITIVSDTRDVEEVILGESGVLHGVRAGSLVIDMSTISPVATQAIAAHLARQGAAMLDAPVSGGSEGAAMGTLSIMVGGSDEDVARARPVLETMGKRITHVGGNGAGQVVKLMNQIVVVGNCLAMCEALLFAQKSGVDVRRAWEAISAGAAGSWMLTNRGPQILERDWRPGFTIELQQKDLRLVLEAADQVGVPVPNTAHIFQLYRTLQERGLGREGNHALVKALEALAGFQVQGSSGEAS